MDDIYQTYNHTCVYIVENHHKTWSIYHPQLNINMRMSQVVQVNMENDNLTNRISQLENEIKALRLKNEGMAKEYNELLILNLIAGGSNY